MNPHAKVAALVRMSRQGFSRTGSRALAAATGALVWKGGGGGGGSNNCQHDRPSLFRSHRANNIKPFKKQLCRSIIPPPSGLYIEGYTHTRNPPNPLTISFDFTNMSRTLRWRASPLMRSRWLLIFFRMVRAGRIRQYGHCVRPSQPSGLCHLQPCTAHTLSRRGLYLRRGMKGGGGSKV